MAEVAVPPAAAAAASPIPVIALPEGDELSMDGQPRASTPNGPNPLSPKKREPSPLVFDDPAPASGPDGEGSDDKDEDAAQPAAAPPARLPAWKSMPGFEDLDESWAQGASTDEAPVPSAKPVVQHEAASEATVSAPLPPLGDSMARSNRIVSSATEGTFFDARASLAASNNQAPNGQDGKPRRTWNETKGGLRSSHLRPHARPILPSLTDSELVLQPGPSSAILRKRSQDVKKSSTRRGAYNDGVDDDNAEAGPSSAPETLERSRREEEGGSHSRSSSQSSSSSRSELKRGGGAEQSRLAVPQATVLGADHGDDVAEEDDNTPSFAGVTASEGGGAGATFIHHSDASSLPPILRPAWQGGQANAIDPRTPGKRGKGAIIGGDMFTPLKLQTMFKTPTPPDGAPVKEIDAKPAEVEHTPSRLPVPLAAKEEEDAAAVAAAASVPAEPSRPTTPPAAKPTSHGAFTFRSPYAMPGSGVTDSPFAHLATPRTQQKKRGLSAEAYAHIGRATSSAGGSTAPGTANGTGAKSLPIRLFVFESAKKMQTSPGRVGGGENDRQGQGQGGAHMAALQDAVRLYDEKLKEAEKRLEAKKRQSTGYQDRARRQRDFDDDGEEARGDAEPEMKRLRLHLPDRRAEAAISSNGKKAAGEVDASTSGVVVAPPLSPMRISVRRQPPPSSPIWEKRPKPATRHSSPAIHHIRDDESPRKLFRKFSAAGQVEREIEAAERATALTPGGAGTASGTDLRASQGWSDDERRRDEELAAIEERIRRRKEGKLAGLATPAASRKAAPGPAVVPTPQPPTRMVLVDENGQSETIPGAVGVSRTYSASSVALPAAAAAAAASAVAQPSLPSPAPARSFALVETIPEVSRETLSSTPPATSVPEASTAPSASLTQAAAPSKAFPTPGSALHHRLQQRRTVSLEAANGSVDQPSSTPAVAESDPFNAPNASSNSNVSASASASASNMAKFPPRREATPKASSPITLTTPARRATASNASTPTSKGTTPILKPTYALHQQHAQGSPHVQSLPKSGSALRNEVVMSDGDSTQSSSITLRDESMRPRTTGTAAAAQSAAAALPPSSAISTPARRPAPPSIPRSILKGSNASIASTPAGTPLRPSRLGGSAAMEPPRSISFADGKTSGKMFSQSPLRGVGTRRGNEWEDSFESGAQDDGEEDSQVMEKGDEATPKPARSRDPKGQDRPSSVRAARIQELLEQVKALALEEEQAGRTDIEQQEWAASAHGDDSWQAPSPTSRFSTRLTPFDSPAATPLAASRRSIASTRRSAGGRSIWNFGDSQADKTFLTQASFEVAHDRIVEVLTDVAPWVDSWDELTELDLSGRKLESVVRLKEFAPRLEKVRLDRNALSYLTGLPAGLRLLTLSGNRVPSIVSFGHLRSLETLDLSGNEVDDLSSLDCLMHLRHLRADANGISDVRGIERLEHLHSLSLRSNKLVSLDLSKTSWRRLSHLDVAHNALTSIKGLWHCKHLKTLDVGSNDLSLLDLGTGLMPRLRSLRVSNNSRLERLDVLPAARSLRTLFADFCALEKIDHLGALDKLEELSVRQQLTKPSKAPGGFRWPGAQVKDVKKLFLSGNAFSEEFNAEAKNVYVPQAGLHNVFGAPPRLPNTSLSACSFNNVAYLELSACQLTAIPPNLAVLFPNLHQLVLDHNLFTRLPPSRSNGKSNGGGLAALSRLKRISLVGCRIKSTRNLIEAFEGCDQLAVLDARMNPATLGLYPPVLASPLVSASSSPSPAFLAPMPNAETLRPDTIEGEMAQKQKERAEEKRGRWEKSFWHKVHPRPEEDGDDSRETEQDGDADADETIKPAKQQSAGPTTASSTSWYAISDTRFSRTLPTQLAMRRLLHRGTLGMVCPALQWLDGLQITDAEVNEAERVLLAEEDEMGPK